MGLFSNPLGYAGYQPDPATASVKNTTVRAATLAEEEAGVLNDVYVAPSTLAASGGLLGPRTAHGVILGEGLTNPLGATAAGATGAVLAGNTGADPSFKNIAALNIVDDSTGTVGTPTQLAVNTSYIADQASVTNGFLLPASASRGDTIIIVGNGVGGWQIQQNASQAIKYNSNTSTTGTGGSVSSTTRYDAIELYCVVGGASTIWNARNVSGTLTFV